MSEKKKITKEEIENSIEEMLTGLANMRVDAMSLPLTHYDYQSLLILLLSILRAD